MLLKELRFDPIDTIDLHWYFNECESDLGLKAQQYEPKYSTCDFQQVSTLTDSVLRAAERYSRIYAIMCRLPRFDQNVLQRWFKEGRKYCNDIRTVFKQYTGIAQWIAIQNKQPIAELRELCFRYVHADSKNANQLKNVRSSIAQARAQAVRALHTAMRNYASLHSLQKKELYAHKKQNY